MRRIGLIFFFMLCIKALAAQTTTGLLEGKVTGTDAIPVAGANILITGENLQGSRGTVTDQQGWFQISALPIGISQVEITHVAYHPSVIREVFIHLAKTTQLGIITLHSRNVEIPEVIIQGERPHIDPMQTEMGGNLNARIIARLPVERSYSSVPTLLPQVNVSYYGDGINTAGATGLENKYFIDGMDVTDPFRGMGGTNLPYNFIQEIQVRTGGYQAEYRSTLGGIVNVVTWSGGNELHGQAFGFYTNKRFAGEPRQPMLTPAQGAFNQYDAGLRLGGPILRDRLWFFAAYNPIREEEKVLIPGQGYYTDRSTTHPFAAKLTWQASRRSNLSFTLFGDPQQRNGVGDLFGTWGAASSFLNPDPFLEKIRRGSINYSLNSYHHLRNDLLLEIQLSLQNSRERHEPQTETGRSQILFIDMEGQWSGGTPSRIDARSTVLDGSASLSYSTSSHLIKGGLEYRDNGLNLDLAGADIYRLGETDYFVFRNRTRGIVHNRIPALFLQDSWQISPRLNIQTGMRWEGQYLIASTGKLAQSIPDQFQPRIGMIFQPGTTGNQKIFVSAGRFYEELSNWFSCSFFIQESGASFDFYSHDPRVDPQNPDTSLVFGSEIRPALRNLSGQYYDAISIGYERMISAVYKIALMGTCAASEKPSRMASIRSAVTPGMPIRARMYSAPSPRLNANIALWKYVWKNRGTDITVLPFLMFFRRTGAIIRVCTTLTLTGSLRTPPIPLTRWSP